MGKRELLLVAAFAVVGVLVYQVTAPASDPTRPGWSLSGIVERMRREVSGNQAQASTTNSSTIEVAESVRELRIEVGVVKLTVVGEDRSDIQAELEVTSNAFDQAEAERTAKASKLKVDEAGPALTISVDFPVEGRQRGSLTLKVPSRMELRVDKTSTLEITNVAAVTLTGRGETTIKEIAGPVQATQRGSTITIADVESLRLSTFSGAEARVSEVHGEANFTLQGGELLAEDMEGAIEIEARNTDIKLQKLESLEKPIRINATNGEVALLGLHTEARIDGRDTDIRVEQSAAAPLSIYNEGNETVEVTLPAEGFKLDALTVDGRLTIDSGLEKLGVKVEGENTQGGESGSTREERRVTATVRGGGPSVTVRASRGDIVLRLK
jgi:hypothetical protein